MITRAHYNELRSVGLQLKALREQLVGILEETADYPIPRSEAFMWQLDVATVDFNVVIEHLDEVAHDVAKHLGVSEHGIDDS